MARINLSDNEYLEKFVSSEHIDSNNAQFWYQLLSCSFNFMRVQDPKFVDKTLDPYLVRLELSNSESFHIGSLLRVFLDRFSKIKSPSGQSTEPYFIFQTFNALYLLRSICKSYIETLGEEQLIKALKARVDVIPSQSPPAPLKPPQQFSSILQQQKPQDTPPQPTNIPVFAPSPPGVSAGVATNNADVELSPAPLPTTNSCVEDTNLSNEMKQSSTTVPMQSEAKIEYTSGSSMFEQYVSTLIAILVDLPLTDSTYLLQVEAINALLVLLSIQMYSSSPVNQPAIYKCLMHKKCSIHALVLTRTLLNNFVEQQLVPQETGSIIIGLASGLWRVLTLGYGAKADEEPGDMALLANQSLLLLNILTHHCTAENNPYREAVISCLDSQFDLLDPQTAIANADNDVMTTATTSKSAMMSNSIKISFRKLYDTLCNYLHNDQVALLLYILLHSNKIFRSYILTTVSPELDRLILPLLKVLYTSIEKGSHHVYMVLILFVILSEELAFNVAIHGITVRSVPWYKDRILSEISLGSLITLIIVRSTQYNTFRVRDKFLHTNLFATLANLSNYFSNLHPYVCQRIVDLLERLAKRYTAATGSANNVPSITANSTLADNPLARALATDTNGKDIQDATSIELDSTISNGLIPSPDNVQSLKQSNASIELPAQQEIARTDSSRVPKDREETVIKGENINIMIDDNRQDLALIEEVIRMVLEVINNSLAMPVHPNTDLIYTLLYKRGVFGSLISSHQSFYDMVINIERILTFFYNKIESQERQLTAAEIKDIILSSSGECLFNQNKDPSSRLLFRYVEDDQPEEFFIPYIWTRIYYSSGIPWNPKRIHLFNLNEV